MRSSKAANPERLWARHNAEWRDPAQVISQWRDAAQVDGKLLEYRVRGQWWETLQKTGVTLLVTREYEHLLLGLCATAKGPRVSYHPLPHPSGLAVERQCGIVYVASTRNPNQLYELRPATGLEVRLDSTGCPRQDQPLIPLRSWFLPGCLYIHDLAFVGSHLYANAVGQNAVVELNPKGGYRRAWWPRCIEGNGSPVFGRNHLQLNSIAAGPSLSSSYFSASCDQIGTRRPGQRNFAVKGRGVIFSGRTRQPIARGLTRPHSARLLNGQIWVDNSGYGEVGVVRDGGFTAVARLPGWTRGLCSVGGVAFVGTSRVIPRFRHYAPGIDVETSQCAVHALESATGRWLGSISWPAGNQIFAIDWLPSTLSLGFAFATTGRRSRVANQKLFYSFEIPQKRRAQNNI
jgi:uncharacterized protein (TIGR03032 family)